MIRKSLQTSWPFWIGLLAFAIFLFLSNGFDWDAFYSFSEVDMRSWLVDHKAPIWSYQLCAGVTRIGDPQGFGLSPLFAFVLVFGSFIGLKLLILFSTWLGWFYLTKIAELVHRVRTALELSVPQRQAAHMLAAFFVFSNYFLWHFHVGHVTFALFYFLFGLVFYVLKYVFQTINRRDAISIFLLTICYLTAGFYHSAVFLGVPVFISLVVLLVAHFASRGLQKRDHQSTWRLLTPLVLGAGLGSYKLLAVIDYHRRFPRTMASEIESYSPIDSIIDQFIPTWNHMFAGIHFRQFPWEIYEYSAFNFLAWIVVVGAALLGWREIRALFSTENSHARRVLNIWLASLFVIACSDTLSSDSLFSMHNWLNLALKNSLRVIGRYQILWIFLFFLLSTLLVLRSTKLQSYLSGPARIAWTILLLANFMTFNTLDVRLFLAHVEMPTTVPDQMQIVTVSMIRNQSASFMFVPLANGGIVPNCYDPFPHDEAFLSEDQAHDRSADGIHPEREFYPLVEGTDVASCKANTYVTQNDLVIDDSCPRGTCLNLNGINIYKPMPNRLAFDSIKHLWCVQ